jgi:hypothetical protein
MGAVADKMARHWLKRMSIKSKRGPHKESEELYPPIVMERAQRGDTKSMHLVMESAWGLIKSRASYWCRMHPQFDYNDLCNEAVPGVYDAVRLFDPAKGKFASYVCYHIDAKMRYLISRGYKADKPNYGPVVPSSPNWFTSGGGLKKDERGEDFFEGYNEVVEQSHGYGEQYHGDLEALAVDAIMCLKDDLEREVIICCVLGDEELTEWSKRKGKHERHWGARIRDRALLRMRLHLQYDSPL